jgi:ATP-independent RNA helicase DbpA
VQVAEQVRRLARHMPNVKVLALCGGVPFAPQRASLRHGAAVVVGTPGRLDEHLRKGSLSLARLCVLVVDEADRMLDMGFEPQLARVVEAASSERQTLLFSATYPDSIAALSQRYQRNALPIDVAPEPRAAPDAADAGASPVQHTFFRVPREERTGALLAWLGAERPESALVFCSTRVECAALADALQELGWSAASIHGEMAQRERQHVMRLFAAGSCSVLCATDVAARGWDIRGLAAVVNVGLSRDPTIHLHRVGRTGRQGHAGRVVSFVSEDDVHALVALERANGSPATFDPLPSPPALPPPSPPRVTLLLSAGKQKKLRPGDILGALTGDGSLVGSDVGPIHVDDEQSYVAVSHASADRARARLESAGVKGRRVRVRVAGLALR